MRSRSESQCLDFGTENNFTCDYVKGVIYQPKHRKKLLIEYNIYLDFDKSGFVLTPAIWCKNLTVFGLVYEKFTPSRDNIYSFNIYLYN